LWEKFKKKKLQDFVFSLNIRTKITIVRIEKLLVRILCLRSQICNCEQCRSMLENN